MVERTGGTERSTSISREDAILSAGRHVGLVAGPLVLLAVVSGCCDLGPLGARPAVEFDTPATESNSNDGLLDLATVGWDGDDEVTKIYRNSGPALNTPPSAPSSLSASVSGTGPYVVTFSWAASSDGQTPADGLSYNLRLGTSSGRGDVVSGMSMASGLRKLPFIGNTQKRLVWNIGDLPAGTYYWSVQAIDSAHAGSPWAAEDPLVVPP
jgi:hypothetical protein